MSSIDITDRIVGSGCYCLNQASNGPYTHLFIGDHTLALKSDADEQLLLHLEFQQTMNLTQLILGLPNDGSCPQTIRLFANVRDLGFNDAADQPAAQILNLEPQATPSTTTIRLNPVKWKSVDSITLFVENNHGADISSLYSLKVFGSPVHGTDVSKISKGWRTRIRF